MIDLHTHSTASDGTLTPALLVGRAAAAGITILALTDHDTTGGCDEAVDPPGRGSDLGDRQPDWVDPPPQRFEDEVVLFGAQHGTHAVNGSVEHHADAASAGTRERHQGRQLFGVVGANREQ